MAEQDKQRAKSDTKTLEVNSWLEDELYQEYLHDRQAVDASWKQVFDANGQQAARMSNGASQPTPAAPRAAAPAVSLGPGDQPMPLRTAALRIAENMTASLAIPTATSFRTVPVKALELHRRLLNQQRKISYTHIVAWALVRALERMPALNNAFAEIGAEPHRVNRAHVNIGIAVDVAGKDGSRSLKVPNIKAAEAMDFARFVDAFDDIVSRARSNKLQVADFEFTTISLTNPGTVGTVGSVPRLMPGQGAIIATGAIDYPPEYRSVSEEIRQTLGLSKVMTVTCTYDHRVIQGAESGMFLGRVEALLAGEDRFYESLFEALGIDYEPGIWRPAAAPAPTPTAPLEPSKQAALAALTDAYRGRGHLAAELDPLGTTRPGHPDLRPEALGLNPEDPAVRETLDRLRATYCGKIGVQYTHLDSASEREWLRERMESTANQWPLDPQIRRRILERLVEAEAFEVFLHTRFMGHKRFSLEGGESAIAILDELLERAAEGGVHEAVIGMAHRGRLTVLSNIVGKSMLQLFGEFEGDTDPESAEGSGDVKYHLGASGVRTTTGGKEIVVSVAFNPSHLEAVNPVVEGIVRPKQDRLGDTRRERVIPVLIHGDAAFAGQGVVAETLNLSQLPGYTTGGTIHLIINNQIGFTTNPSDGRSTVYASDIALAFQSPVFHVNGDDPEACVRVTQLALDFRQKFHKDVVIDMICYRKHGHNEADDPSYTQPLLYKRIRAQKPVAAQYAERLARESIMSAPEVEAVRKRFTASLNAIHDEAQRHKDLYHYEFQELSAIAGDSIGAWCPRTAVDRATLQHIVEGITTFPGDFHLHPKLRGFIDKRHKALDGAPIDWPLAEIFALGSMLLEGTPVRLAGQDVARGTFSQRHVAYFDAQDGRMHVPLQHLAPVEARFEVCNSPLSEYAAMGFELGYSVGDPLTLVIWEAQFGDFANGAQIVIDQFLAACESKWSQPSGLVLLLPHGQEGQGPEHSSARLERFLQLAAEGNMQVCNCTTPANYFHLLRRQMYGGPDRRGMRKPLVVLTPKSLLRDPRAVSVIDEFEAGTFQPVIADPAPAHTRKVVFCTGKVYYDLAASKPEDVALVRMEQMYPFPKAEIEAALANYPRTAEITWAQEEPRNAGGWVFFKERSEGVLGDRTLTYAGRHRTASPAAGSLKRHQQEQADLVQQAFLSTPAGPKPRRRLVRKPKNKS